MNSTDEENCTEVTKKTKNQKMSIDRKKTAPTTKATQHSIKETIIIEPDLMGLVIGRKGCNLKRLAEFYRVKITKPPRGGSVVTIEGPAKAVSAARKDIEQNLSCKTSFFIENDRCGQVIGRDGEIVRALQDALNVKIWIKEDGEVLVTGTRWEEAKRSIEEILSHKTSVFVERDIRYLIIGPEGETIHALEKAHNVAIRVKEDGEVVVMGERCEEAKKSIIELLSRMTSVFVEKDYRYLVIGQEGETIRALANAFNVMIEMKEDGEVVIMGERCEKAKKSIEENISRITSFFIEKDYRHLVIGPEGRNKRALETAHKVTMRIKEDGEVLIMGKESEEAKKGIESLVERLKTAYPYKEEFSVPACLIRFVCGKNGANRIRIEFTHSVHVVVTEASNKDGPQLIIVKGSSAESVTAAKKDILENLPSASSILDVDESSRRCIIGRGGETVHRLEKEHEVTIGLGGGKVYIFGEKDRAEAARDAIVSIISEELKKTDVADSSP